MLYYISEWVIRLLMLPIVTRRRQPNAALAWLAVIFFIPWVGLILYLMIGESTLSQRRLKRRARIVNGLKLRDRLTGQGADVVRPEIAPDQHDLALLSERIGGIQALGGNAVEMLTDSDDVIERIIADVDAARDHVHMVFYIFAPDETGERVGAALVRAAARGVRVRLLVDAVASRLMLRDMAPRLRAGGVETLASLPVDPIRERLARVDLRNHRKVVVIDGRIGYTGSQNIVNADYGKKGVGAWVDLMVRLEGPAVLQLQEVFFEDWASETRLPPEGASCFPHIEPVGDVPVQTVPSGPALHTEAFGQLTVAAINEAASRVILTTPYFVPDEPLMLALRLAVLRGASVDLVLPLRGDHPLVAATSRAYFDELLRASIRVHLYRDGLLHSKTISVDDAFAFVGSGNLDIRSFKLNFEVTMLLYGPAPAKRLREIQLGYIERSDHLDPEVAHKRGWIKRTVDDVAKLMSPLL